MPYVTTAPVYGLLPQLFDSSIKSAVQNAACISDAVNLLSQSYDSISPIAEGGSQLLSLIQAIAENPPVFTVYNLAGPNGTNFTVTSPSAPLFNFVV